MAKRRQRRPASRPIAGSRRENLRRGWLRDGRIIAALSSVLLLLLGALATPLGERVTDFAFSVEPRGRLEKVDLLVNETNAAEGISPTTLDIKVQNTGKARIVIKRLRLEVLDFLSISVCSLQGELEISGSYDVVMPSAMKPGDRHEHPLNQQLASDEADRFVVRFQLASIPDLPAVSLYRVRASLETNGDPVAVDLGTVFMSLPFVPSNEGDPWYWSKEYQADPHSMEWAHERAHEIEICMRENSRQLRQFLSKPGQRSGPLSVLELNAI